MSITELKALAEKATPGPWVTGNTYPLLFGVNHNPGTEPIGFVYGPAFAENSDFGRRALATSSYIAAANPAAILELIAQLEDAHGEIRALRATEAGLLERVKELEEGISSLLSYADKNTCTHEETYRGGAIWTICRACDAKWADDEGGMPEWEDPKELAAARALLEKQQ